MNLFQLVCRYNLSTLAAGGLLATFCCMVHADIIVAADGSGQFTTIQEAIVAAPNGTQYNPTTIHVCKGIYHETVKVGREKRFIKLVGNSLDQTKTVITYGLYAAMLGADNKPIGTFSTPTVFVDADDISIANIDFVNSARSGSQAIAIRVDGDRVSFKNCRFDGWQDTVLDNLGRHYYDHCTVYGAIDFIFGGACSVYDHSNIIELRNRGGKITAPSTPQGQSYGLTFLNCRLGKGPQVLTGETYLMRPWRLYGESAFINCILDDEIKPEGWEEWAGKEKTCRAFEYNSRSPNGTKIGVSQRASWSHQLTSSEASQYTLAKIFKDWNPKSQQ